MKLTEKENYGLRQNLENIQGKNKVLKDGNNKLKVELKRAEKRERKLSITAFKNSKPKETQTENSTLNLFTTFPVTNQNSSPEAKMDDNANNPSLPNPNISMACIPSRSTGLPTLASTPPLALKPPASTSPSVSEHCENDDKKVELNAAETLENKSAL